MRVFLESFRLPGEAPIISRIMEHFSEHWLTVNGKNTTVFGSEFVNKDSVYILCYAIILLNVDQHNRQNKNPMTEAVRMNFVFNFFSIFFLSFVCLTVFVLAI